VVNVALTSFRGDEVPQVTNLQLAYAVDSTEALFQPVRIPGQVVIDHEVRILKVHALTRSVSCDEYAHIWVGAKQGLKSATLVPMRTSVNRYDGNRLLPSTPAIFPCR